MSMSQSLKASLVLTLFCVGSAAIAAEQDGSLAIVQNDWPEDPPKVVELEELWRVGGDEDEHVYGLMIDARCDEAGHVYLLDHQLSHVLVVSPQGEYIGELGGEGDGPGECRQPQTLTMMPDGTVGLGQRFPGRFIKVDRDGTPAGQVELGGENAAQTGFTMLVSGRNRGGTFLAGSLHQVPGENGQTRDTFLHGLAPDGEKLTQFAVHSTTLDFAKAHFVERDMVAPFIAAHNVGPDGRVYLTPDRNKYRVKVLTGDGEALHIITRKFDPPQRDKQALDRMNALFEEQDRALPFRITWEVEPLDQVVDELIVTADNRLLVHHSRSGMNLPQGIFASYDVFDKQGRWLHELHVKTEADPDHDGLIFLDDGRVLLVRGLQLARLTASGNGGSVGEEDDGAMEIEIICCRLKS
jgi:hypothetical protein